MEVKAGFFDANLTASQVVSGLGFATPCQLILFFGGSPATPTPARGTLDHFFGFQADGGARQIAHASTSLDNEDTTIELRGAYRTESGLWVVPPLNLQAGFTVSAYGTDSFDLAWNPVPGTAYRVGYLAFAGLTAVHCNQVNLTPPTTELVMGGQVNYAQLVCSETISHDDITLNTRVTWGATATGSTGQALGLTAINNQDTSRSGSMTQSGAMAMPQNADTVRGTATWGGWSALGVTVTGGVGIAGNSRIGYFGIEGDFWAVDEMVVPPGPAPVTEKWTLPFAPKALQILSCLVSNAQPLDGIQADAVISVGATDGTTSYVQVGTNRNNMATSTVWRATDEDAVLLLLDSLSGAILGRAQATLLSDGFELNWTHLDAAAENTRLIFMAGGDTAAGPPSQPLAGELLGVGILAGDLTVTGPASQPLAGELLGLGYLAGDLTVTAPGAQPLAGELLGVGYLAGRLTLTHPLAGELLGVGYLAGNLEPIAPGSQPLAGELLGLGYLAGDVQVGGMLSGELLGVGYLVGRLVAPAATGAIEGQLYPQPVLGGRMRFYGASP